MHVSFGLLELRVICVLLDEKKRLPFFDYIPVFEIYAFEIAFHARRKLHGVDCLRVAAYLLVIDDIHAHGAAYRDLRRGKRKGRLLLVAACRDNQHEAD